MTDADSRMPTRSFRVLGVPVAAVQISTVIPLMEAWISERQGSRFIAVTGMHGVMEAQHDPDFGRILAQADLIVPDGMPLVWLARLRGFPLRRRVYGPELMTEFCHHTATKKYRHFLYGGNVGVADRLADELRKRFPGILIVGTYTPPFRELTIAEDAGITDLLNKSRADLLWVALGVPQQERWMYMHRERLSIPVMIGVGAAFDFHARTKRQAPFWMREHGLEWLFRLLQEPRRLSRRYIVYGTEFVIRILAEQIAYQSDR